MTERIVLSIDPGRKKCGLAVVDTRLQLIAGEIVGTEQLVNQVKRYLERYSIDCILIGSGTNCGEIMNSIRQRFPDSMLIEVTEKDSTMLARKRYFDYYPPTGFLKILPVSLRVPPRPYDDFAALVIAERYFQIHKKGDCKNEPFMINHNQSQSND